MKIQALPFVVLSWLVGCPAVAAAQADSTELPAPHIPSTDFRPRRLILPAALITVGAWGVKNGAIQSLDHDVRRGMEHLRGDCRFHADDYVQYLPVVAHVGLGLTGVKARHPLHERLLATATSYAAMGIMVNGIKWAVDERRPDSGALNSFPSGHTATAIMGAELVRLEYGNAIGGCAYAVAGGIAFLRLYNDRHWLNDLLAGAGIGLLSARIGYWLLPVWQRLFHWDKRSQTAAMASPLYLPHTRGLGVAVAICF